MSDPNLQARDREVLRAVIEAYLASGEPVGSRTVSREHPESLSPATIRNVMADLEYQGLLEQPHPSAGRTPTDRAIRYYVEEMLGPQSVPVEERSRIETALRTRGGEAGALLEEASRLLAGLSHNVGIVLVPPVAHMVFERIHFLRIGHRRIAALFASVSGMVNHRVIEPDEDYPQEELDRVSRYLSETFRGLPLGEIRVRLLELATEEKALYDRLMREALELSARTFEGGEIGGTLIVEGTGHLLERRSFSNPDQMRALFKAVEEKTRLVALLNRCLDDGGPRLLMGSETGTPAMEGCALVASPYRDGTGPVGTLGVLGPARMEYARVIAIVDALARILSELLSAGDGGSGGRRER